MVLREHIHNLHLQRNKKIGRAAFAKCFNLMIDEIRMSWFDAGSRLYCDLPARCSISPTTYALVRLFQICSTIELKIATHNFVGASASAKLIEFIECNNNSHDSRTTVYTVHRTYEQHMIRYIQRVIFSDEKHRQKPPLIRTIAHSKTQ